MSNPGGSSLTAWWKLDEAAGQSRYNSVPDAGALTLSDYNTVGWKVNVARPFNGGSADFVATGLDYLRSLDSSNLLRPGNNSFSMGLWIKPHNVGAAATIMTKWNASGSAMEYAIGMHSNGKARLDIHDGSTGYVKYCDPVLMTSNNWYFVTAYYDAVTNLIKIGTNNSWSSLAGPSGGIAVTSADFYLGRSQSGIYGYFDGLMADAFFYNHRLLTPAEWTWLYNSGQGRRYEDTIETPPPVITIETQVVIPLIHVFNSDLEPIGIIENYYSLNWAERYNELGDFELELPVEYIPTGGQSDELMTFGNFLYIPNSDKLMIIEDLKPSFTDEKISLLVNGRSAESILERRVLLDPLTWYAPAESLVYVLVNDHVRDPLDADRKISLFNTANDAFWPPSMPLNRWVNDQWDIQSIYGIIESVCKLTDLGFKIVVEDLHAADSELYFHVYEGTDRSSGNGENDLVIFSETYDNVIASSFYSSEKDKVNTTFVVTELIPGDPDEEPTVQRYFVWDGGSDEEAGGTEPTDLDRYESFLIGTIDKDTNDDDIDDVTAADILLIIQKRGEEVIKEAAPIGIFEGDFDTRGLFKIGEDFFIGDIVQCVMHGQDLKARIIEVVRSYSAEGEKVYVAFDFLV